MTKFTGNPDYSHDSSSRLGVLLTNLGTPDAPTTAAVRRYLAEFLSDPRVIEVPRLIWWFILHGYILRTRPQHSAKIYKSIWTNEGSPLLSFSSKLAAAVQLKLDQLLPGPVQVELAMRYGNPSIRAGLEKLRQGNAQHLLILPLYPQYSATTTASTFDAIADVLKKWRWLPELRMINHYHDDHNYINALANSIRTHWQHRGRSEKLLFSFHGIPKHYFAAGDPYHCECHKTARLVAEVLGLEESDWLVTFQSRFGPREWLQPYTDVTLKELARKGIKNVNVICPGFPADCLETLEEINIQYRALFLTCGGEEFNYIPALNDHTPHIDVLSILIIQHCQGWPEVSGNRSNQSISNEINLRGQRVQKLLEKEKPRES
jgi:ferrochelatase